jgi:hypothetical protein
MSVGNEVQAKQSGSVELESLNQRERLVLQMFRQLDRQGQMDILRFIDVMLKA